MFGGMNMGIGVIVSQFVAHLCVIFGVVFLTKGYYDAANFFAILGVFWILNGMRIKKS